MTAPPDVLMLSGFSPTATDVVIRTLLAEEPAVRLIRYCFDVTTGLYQ